MEGNRLTAGNKGQGQIITLQKFFLFINCTSSGFDFKIIIIIILFYFGKERGWGGAERGWGGRKGVLNRLHAQSGVPGRA